MRLMFVILAFRLLIAVKNFNRRLKFSFYFFCVEGFGVDLRIDRKKNLKYPYSLEAACPPGLYPEPRQLRPLRRQREPRPQLQTAKHLQSPGS